MLKDYKKEKRRRRIWKRMKRGMRNSRGSKREREGERRWKGEVEEEMSAVENTEHHKRKEEKVKDKYEGEEK